MAIAAGIVTMAELCRPLGRCPVHGRPFQRSASPGSFLWSTCYSSLESLAPNPPLKYFFPEKGCEISDDGVEPALCRPGPPRRE
jgi:hypothetical protein